MDSLTALAICASMLMIGGVMYMMTIICLSRMCLRAIHPSDPSDTTEMGHQHGDLSTAMNTSPQCTRTRIPNVVRQPDGTIGIAFDDARTMMSV